MCTQVQLLKDRYDESVGQKNALMEESQMLQVSSESNLHAAYS